MMERCKISPNWLECTTHNTPEHDHILQSLLEGAQIFPNELFPRSDMSWEGIPFRDWYYHITEGKPLFADLPLISSEEV